MNYSTYLSSAYWKKQRLKKLSSYPHCRICGSTQKLNIHHKFYKKKNGESVLFREKKSELITLCSSCHKFWHLYCQNKFLDKKGRPNISKKILGIRELLFYGVKKQWAFRIIGLGLWSISREKIKKFALEKKLVMPQNSPLWKLN